ncbi:alkylhydroperoxidase AhpD family core domain [Providencia rustigianii]|uniref:carboxymuconolactone decarboxylase family protein n=1 Tax=Providencia TaxID=586 RepID=UPI000F6ECD46|nr:MULTISPECIES: carboxymuconolactone decarboxylase family protein [Providencia]MTC57129.1 carboxymuconolactone decarboxylase family protein [Providencia rustigianii]VEB68657.1 alkylhydroperoxidase AhpD family core domain [Providencia rustigianii]
MTKFKQITQDLLLNIDELAKNIPDVINQFSRLQIASTNDGALDKKTKELIAIGIAVANRCDGCIGFHTKTLVDLGVTKQELTEALGVAILMGGGPSVMYATETLRAYNEFIDK